jgi:polysaccharide deacetylase family protein (PEP-CTERM system associated)
MRTIDQQTPRTDLTSPKVSELVNALTVDVEDYFQVQAFEGRFPRSLWDDIPCRVEENIDYLLALFSKGNVRATFFTLGWIAERHPDMVRRIAAEGHELASHGYDHRRVDELQPSAFREDIRRAKRTIEDIIGMPVIGYRAPTFSISARNEWAYEILEDQGYSYSSSSYPIRHDLYGDAAGLRRPFQPRSGTVWEFPLSTRRLLRQNIPAAGGGYFRLFPYRISLMNLRHINAVECVPCIFYCHPWEIDANQPRVSGISKRTRLRHYMNLKTMPRRLARLIRDLRWDRMDIVFANWIGNAPSKVTEPAKA